MESSLAHDFEHYPIGVAICLFSIVAFAGLTWQGFMAGKASLDDW